MKDPNNLTTLVPQGVIRRLKTHFVEKISEAVARYRFNEADEDSITGALGHALSVTGHFKMHHLRPLQSAPPEGVDG